MTPSESPDPSGRARAQLGRDLAGVLALAELVFGSLAALAGGLAFEFARSLHGRDVARPVGRLEFLRHIADRGESFGALACWVTGLGLAGALHGLWWVRRGVLRNSPRRPDGPGD